MSGFYTNCGTCPCDCVAKVNVGSAQCKENQRTHMQKQLIPLDKPLSNKELKAIMSKGRVKKNRISVNLNFDMEDLIDCGNIDAFNEIVDNRVFADSGYLGDINYKVVGVHNGQIIINVDAEVEL